MTCPHPRADILGRLLVAVQVLDLLPTRESMESFLESALGEIPGVSSIKIWSTARCDAVSEGGELALAGVAHDSIPIRTHLGKYGCLRVNLDDRMVYSRYRAFLINLGYMLGTILENRNNAARLAEANVQLTTLVNELEERVEERTRHILKDQESLSLSGKVFEASTEGIVITNADQEILSVNRAFSAITGYSREEVLGKTPRILSSGEQDNRFYKHLWAALRHTGQWQGEILNRRRNGEVFPEWLSISSVCNSVGVVTHYVGMFSDITERKRTEERITYLAHHDMLTELPNRVYFRSRFDYELSRAMRHNSRFSILFLDLDQFREVNDLLGHRGGDQLLQNVAHRLVECLRHGDTAARHGGDEFLILLPGIGTFERVASIVTSLLDRVALPYEIGESEICISASVGIAMYPTDGDDFNSLMHRADTAMYQAKEAGRNTYRFFDPDMNHSTIRFYEVRAGLRDALEKNELDLFYQPQVNLQSGLVVGAEALLRWYRAGREVLGPGEFIKVAESSGLIAAIGKWVIERACRDAVSWQTEGLPSLLIAVNVSAIQFRRGNFEKIVCNALDETGLAAGCLELELTESALIDDNEAVYKTVSQLKSRGISLAIDDFGTGYSNLTYLKRFRVDRLKIDQSFVRGLPEDRDNLAIVNAVVDIAHRLGMRTVAEGVETEESAAALRRLNCGEAQGYWFSRPMNAADFKDMLRRTKAIVGTVV